LNITPVFAGSSEEYSVKKPNAKSNAPAAQTIKGKYFRKTIDSPAAALRSSALYKRNARRSKCL
jgi:hypothetical protein